MSENNIKKSTVIRIISIIVAIVIIVYITLVLLYMYGFDLFSNKNTETLSLDLNDRTITIPLEHEEMFSTPTICCFKSDKNIDEIFQMFTENINANEDEMIMEIIGEVSFLYLYTDDTFIQSIFIEPFGEKDAELRIGVNEFIPSCLFDSGNDFSELFQDKEKLKDGGVYSLEDKLYPDSMLMLSEYLSQIYDITNYTDNSISLIVDNKNIILEYNSN